MSQEYFPSVKIPWREFFAAPLPAPLEWHDLERTVKSSEENHPWRIVVDREGENYVHVRGGRAQAEDPEIAYFEVYGLGGLGGTLPVLRRLAEHYRCAFVMEYLYEIVLPTGVSACVPGRADEWNATEVKIVDRTCTIGTLIRETRVARGLKPGGRDEWGEEYEEDE